MAKSINNVAIVARLQKMGITISGAKQVLAAQAVTNQKDRDLLAKLVEHVVAGETVRRYNLLESWPSN